MNTSGASLGDLIESRRSTERLFTRLSVDHRQAVEHAISETTKPEAPMTAIIAAWIPVVALESALKQVHLSLAEVTSEIRTLSTGA